MLKTSRTSSSRPIEQDIKGALSDDLLRLLILRIMIPLDGALQLLINGFSSSRTAKFLDMPASDDVKDGSIPITMSLLRQSHSDMEAKAIPWVISDELRRNSESLSVLMGLNVVERRLLEFSIIIHVDRMLNKTADSLGGLSNQNLYFALSILLDLPLAEIREALSGKGRLASAGLLTLDANSNCCLSGKLDLLSEKFVDQMMTEVLDPAQLLRGMLNLSTPPTLSLMDYPHFSTSLELLKPYLGEAIAQQRRGVNIFLYGAPGTGKSELARVLAKDLGCELFEVASEDSGGNPLSGERRLRSYRAAQNFLSKRTTFLLFDEVEDVFNDGSHQWGRKSTAQVRKAWMNRILEENPVPSIWLSNTVDEIDQAFMRRFDMVFELPAPPKKLRENIVRSYCADFLDEKTVNTLADAEGLTPAVITRAAGVIQILRNHLPIERIPQAMSHLVSNALQAQGCGSLRAGRADSQPSFYDPRFINTSKDLVALAARLQLNPWGSVCLYGPSGTGKTAFGRWLADQLGRPLLVKRASDLLAPFLGQTEQNIAACFREAMSSNSVLLIDEVDSFLQDRRRAQRPWEVTQVNEMLTQMESFSGLFIASTNLMEGLDPATLRRFDMKLRFDYLKPSQARSLFACQCKDLDLPEPSANEFAAIERMSLLTPGDFAVLRRQARMSGLGSVNEALTLLMEECALKEDGRKRNIGFVQDVA